MEVARNDYLISTDFDKLDISHIHQFLSTQCYWAMGRPYEIIERAIQHSLCFGLYQHTLLVGFARVVTDYSTFAWLCDVFIMTDYRGEGLGKWLVETIVSHPDLKNLRRFLLATSDAHELYRNYGGFEALHTPERWMERLQK